jgi:hypothetical protein
MHTIGKERDKVGFYFYDASNDLVYNDDLVIEEGKLIKAKTVINKKTGNKIGCFIGQQIVRNDDPRYGKVMRNWDSAEVDTFSEIQSSEKHMTEEDIIRKRI